MALLHLVTVTMLWAATAMSLPIKDRQQPLVPGCDSIDKYNMTWFLNNAKPEYQRELVGEALFYTAGASKAAQEMACGSKGNAKKYVTIWQIWPENLYNEEITDTNPLHCIHEDSALQEKYYSSMSEAYARMARVSATVMHTTKDYRDPPMTGIWGKIELPALRLQTNIFEMTKMRADRIQSEPWKLPDKGTKAMYTSAIKEITDIFAKASLPARSKMSASDEACRLWSSMQGSYLDANQ